MSFFNDIVNKIFPKEQNENVAKQPLIREQLRRSNDDKMEIMLWKESEEKEQVCSFILEQFRKSKSEEENISLFRVINSGTTKGFMLRYLAETEQKDFQFLFDHLRDQVKEKQYTIYSSDVRTYDRGKYVERIERHYLKPSWRVLNTKDVNDTGKMNQLYGNITIEFHLHNNHPQFIKFVCQHYVDSKFSEPLDFNELLEHLCGS